MKEDTAVRVPINAVSSLLVLSEMFAGERVIEEGCCDDLKGRVGFFVDGRRDCTDGECVGWIVLTKDGLKLVLGINLLGLGDALIVGVIDGIDEL